MPSKIISTEMSSIRKKKRNLSESDVEEKKCKDLMKTCKKKIKLAFSENDTVQKDHLSELVAILEQERDNSLISNVFELICGHSKFIDVLVNEGNNFDRLRKEVIDVLSVCISRDKTLCKMELIPILLAAYNASLSSIDQQILNLIVTHEKNGCEVINLHPSIWGPKAIEYYSIRKDIKLRLMSQPKLEQILQQYRRNLFMKTIFSFPRNVHLSAHDKFDGSGEIYDPRYVLCSLYHSLAPDSLLNCDKFVEFRALSFVIASLSSESEQIRSLGYSVLARFYNHVQGATFNKNRFLWILLIDLLRTSVTTDNECLSSLITYFLTRVIEVLLQPTNNLYSFVRKFLEDNQKLSKHLIPKIVVKLLETTDIQKRSAHQRFALNILANGLKCDEDFNICRSSGIFNILLTLYSSPLIESIVRRDILEVFESASKLQAAVNTLCIELAFLSWIKLAILEQRNKEISETILITVLSSIVGNIWNFCERMLEANGKYKLYPTFIGEILLVMNSLFECSCKTSYSEYIICYLNVIDASLNMLLKQAQTETYRRIIFSQLNVQLMISVCNENVFSENNAKEEAKRKVISILLKSIESEVLSNIHSNTVTAEVIMFLMKNGHFEKDRVTGCLTNILANEQLLISLKQSPHCLQELEEWLKTCL